MLRGGALSTGKTMHDKPSKLFNSETRHWQQDVQLMQQVAGCCALPGRRTAAACGLQAVLMLCLRSWQSHVQQQQQAASYHADSKTIANSSKQWYCV